jgi:3-oxoacyl-ACP reductase-like protein
MAAGPAASGQKVPATPARKAPAAKPPTRAATPAAPKPSPAPAAAPPAAVATPPLDLKSLEQRLKETNAIGVMTKLSLKNQVDDLLDRFRDYYAGRSNTTLAELRPAFDLLVMKVLSLLQDSDTALAKAIHDSREAIWAILSNRERFAQYA